MRPPPHPEGYAHHPVIVEVVRLDSLQHLNTMSESDKNLLLHAGPHPDLLLGVLLCLLKLYVDPDLQVYLDLAKLVFFTGAKQKCYVRFLYGSRRSLHPLIPILIIAARNPRPF